MRTTEAKSLFRAATLIAVLPCTATLFCRVSTAYLITGKSVLSYSLICKSFQEDAPGRYVAIWTPYCLPPAVSSLK